MRTSYHRRAGLVIAGAAALLAAGGAARCQDTDPRLERVFEGWKKRQERINTVRCWMTGEAVQPKGAFRVYLGAAGKNSPPRDIRYTIKRSLVLDIPRNRYRQESEREEYDSGTDKLYPRVETQLFDGEYMKYYRPRERNTHPVTGVKPSDPELGFGKGYLQGTAAFTRNWYPLFYGLGIVPTEQAMLLAGKLNVRPDIGLLYVHAQDGVHQGRRCLVLRSRELRQSPLTTSFEEYWIDLERESALLRYSYMVNKIPHIDIDTEYKATEGIWMPHRWTYTQREFSTGFTFYIEKMRISDMALNAPISDADFQIEERPSMVVAEVKTREPEQGEPVTESDVQTRLFRVDESGKRREIDGESAGRSLTWLWASLVTALLFVAVVCWYFFRRKRIHQLPHA